MGEACETQTWLDHALRRSYISHEDFESMDAAWQQIGAMLYVMIMKAEKFSAHYTRK